jgi:hypothetical protein
MSTTTQEPRTDPMRRLYRTRWFMPAFALFLGVLIAGAYWIGDQPGLAAEAFGVMAVMAAIFWFGARRSETISGLGGPGRDERWERIDVHATALAGIAVITAIIGAWLVDVAQGGDGSPYTQLGAFAGVAYLLAVVFLRWRS